MRQINNKTVKQLTKNAYMLNIRPGCNAKLMPELNFHSVSIFSTFYKLTFEKYLFLGKSALYNR